MDASGSVNQQQFTTYYHGSNKHIAASVREHGLTSSSYDRNNPTLSDHQADAGYFATRSGGKGTMVTVRVPHGLEDQYFHKAEGHLRALKQPVPPEHLSAEQFG